MTKNMKKGISPVYLIVQVIACIITALVVNYLFVTPLNLHSSLFWFKIWIMLFCVAIAFVISSFLMCFLITHSFETEAECEEAKTKIWKPMRVFVVVAGALCVFNILSAWSGAEIFNADRYADLIDVEETNSSVIPELTDANIALMDTESAKMLGDREIGEIENFSAFEVSDNYVQLNVNNMAVKVSALDYTGFFKWLQNRESGVPGYVIVSATDMDAEYVELETRMRYTPGAFFGDNLMRYVQSQYPTTMFYDYHLEIDEEGTPYYIMPTYETTIGMFGGEKITGAMIVDPVSGVMDYYDIEEIPEWVDVVVHGDLATQQYNLKYKNINGWWNGTGLGANTDCRKTTDDYGYVIKDNDVYLYTGVTSYASDNSNLGFILVNERTGEFQYIQAAGANEASAVASANGLAQNYGYSASFPSLVTVNGELTYLGVMTDNARIVRRYYMVNVEDYGLVAVNETLDATLADYTGLSDQAGTEQYEPQLETGFETDTEVEGQQVTFVVDTLVFAEKNGTTYVYLGTETEDIYVAEFDSNRELMFVEPGDTITGTIRNGLLVLWE